MVSLHSGSAPAPDPRGLDAIPLHQPDGVASSRGRRRGDRRPASQRRRAGRRPDRHTRWGYPPAPHHQPGDARTSSTGGARAGVVPDGSRWPSLPRLVVQLYDPVSGSLGALQPGSPRAERLASDGMPSYPVGATARARRTWTSRTRRSAPYRSRPRGSAPTWCARRRGAGPELSSPSCRSRHWVATVGWLPPLKSARHAPVGSPTTRPWCRTEPRRLVAAGGFEIATGSSRDHHHAGR